MSAAGRRRVLELLSEARGVWRYEEGRGNFVAALVRVADSGLIGPAEEAALVRVVAHVLRCDLEQGVRDLEGSLRLERDPHFRRETKVQLGEVRELVERCRALEAT